MSMALLATAVCPAQVGQLRAGKTHDSAVLGPAGIDVCRTSETAPTEQGIIKSRP